MIFFNFLIPPFLMSQFVFAKGQEITETNFFLLQYFQRANDFFFIISALASKIGQIKKQTFYHIWYHLPHFRVEIMKKKINRFLKNWSQEKLKTTSEISRPLFIVKFQGISTVLLNNCQRILWTGPLGALLLPPVRHSRKFYKGILFYCAE